MMMMMMVMMITIFSKRLRKDQRTKTNYCKCSNKGSPSHKRPLRIEVSLLAYEISTKRLPSNKCPYTTP